MSNADAIWLGIEAPDNLSVVTAVLRFEGPVDWARFTETVRLRMVGRYPRFTRRALPPSSLCRSRTLIAVCWSVFRPLGGIRG